MFNPNQNDVRTFFFSTYNKAQQHLSLTDIEKIAYSIILSHTEYEYIFKDQAKYLTHQWLPEDGDINPILHFALHLTLIEQLAIANPPELNNLYAQMLQKLSSQHLAEHEIMDCIAEMIWQANRGNTSPDINVCLNAIRKKLGIID